MVADGPDLLGGKKKIKFCILGADRGPCGIGGGGGVPCTISVRINRGSVGASHPNNVTGEGPGQVRGILCKFLRRRVVAFAYIIAC